MTRTSRAGDAGHEVCTECRHRVEGDLVDLPELYAISTFTVALSDDGDAHPLVAVQGEVLRGLARWCEVVADGRGVTAPEEPCVRRLTSFLAIHLDWLLALEEGVDFVDDVADLTDALRSPDQYLSRNEK